MTIVLKTSPAPKIVVDLDGPDGNAFFLLGLARKLCRQMGEDPAPLVAELTSRDYEHLVTEFDRRFGDLVDLHRSPKEAEPD